MRTRREKEVAQEALVDETSTHAPSQHGKREASGDAWEEARKVSPQEVQTWIESGQQAETCGHVRKTLQAGVGLEALAQTPGALVAHIVAIKAAIQV